MNFSGNEITNRGTRNLFSNRQKNELMNNEEHNNIFNNGTHNMPTKSEQTCVEKYRWKIKILIPVGREFENT